jgi:hypothetical protein
MKQIRMLAALCVLALGLLPSAQAAKQLDWQTGILRDSERSRYFAGTVGDSNTNGNVNAYGNNANYHSCRAVPNL